MTGTSPKCPPTGSGDQAGRTWTLPFRGVPSRLSDRPILALVEDRPADANMNGDQEPDQLAIR